MVRAYGWVLLAGTAVFLTATGVLVSLDNSGGTETARKPELRLHVTEQQGRIRVDWDPTDPAIRSARSARLTARDGNTSHEYPVTEEALRGGGLDYLRRSDDVLLTLKLDGSGAEATVRAVVAPQAAVPAAEPPAPSTSKSQSRARRSRGRR